MDIQTAEFKRKFSTSLYKNLKLSLADMAFFKDFSQDKRGDLYPVLERSDDCIEEVAHNLYTVKNGSIQRFFCQFFPYATYALSIRTQTGVTGFAFALPDCEARIFTSQTELIYQCQDVHTALPLPAYADEKRTMIVSCRPGAFDVFFMHNGKAEFFHKSFFCIIIAFSPSKVNC